MFMYSTYLHTRNIIPICKLILTPDILLLKVSLVIKYSETCSTKIGCSAASYRFLNVDQHVSLKYPKFDRKPAHPHPLR